MGNFFSSNPLRDILMQIKVEEFLFHLPVTVAIRVRTPKLNLQRKRVRVMNIAQDIGTRDMFKSGCLRNGVAQLLSAAHSIGFCFTRYGYVHVSLIPYYSHNFGENDH